MRLPVSLLIFISVGCSRISYSEPEWPPGRPEGDYSDVCWSREVSCYEERRMIAEHKRWSEGSQYETETLQEVEKEEEEIEVPSEPAGSPNRSVVLGIGRAVSEGMLEYSRTLQRLQEQQRLDNIQRDLERLKWQQSNPK